MNVNIDGREKKARKYKKKDVQFLPNSHRREGQEGANIYNITFLKIMFIFSKYPFNIFEEMLSTRFHQQN